MSETSNYDPGAWKGYDFDAARKTYDVHVGRSYNAAKVDNKRAADLVPDVIKTDSPSPLVILCDVTGSMGDWPATIFSKLPYLDNECKEYLGDEMEVSFAATGDVGDSYPLQVRGFSKGRELEVQLKELIIEGGGSGPDYATESYELAALYYANNVEMPKAKNPILIFIGDEYFHQNISKTMAKFAKVDIKDEMTAKKAFQNLKEKFAVYLIRKPYVNHDKAITKQWADVLGEDHIAELPSPDRVVDVIFGILAKETDKVNYFKAEIEERQRKDQVDTVYKSLKTIHSLSEKNEDKSKSVFHKSISGTKTKRLLP